MFVCFRCCDSVEMSQLNEVNQHLLCALCSGYLVDATAVIECLHTCQYSTSPLSIFTGLAHYFIVTVCKTYVCVNHKIMLSDIS